MKRPYFVKDRPETEAGFQERIVAWARLNGWRTYHTYDSRRSTPGFPDLICAREDGTDLVVLEVKAKNGRVTKDQEWWIDTFRAAGITADIVRPADWGWVADRLRTRRGAGTSSRSAPHAPSR